MPETPNDLREQLIDALKHHDWFYEYSDDFREWSAGNAHHQKILNLRDQVADGEALYQQYKPKR